MTPSASSPRSGHSRVDLHGFSLGGMVAQVIALRHPELVRKLILTGTGPAGGVGIDKVTRLMLLDIARGVLTFKDPKTYLFFTHTANGKHEAVAFLDRLKERTEDREEAISVPAMRAQLTGPARRRSAAAASRAGGSSIRRLPLNGQLVQ